MHPPWCTNPHWKYSPPTDSDGWRQRSIYIGHWGQTSFPCFCPQHNSSTRLRNETQIQRCDLVMGADSANFTPEYHRSALSLSLSLSLSLPAHSCSKWMLWKFFGGREKPLCQYSSKKHGWYLLVQIIHGSLVFIGSGHFTWVGLGAFYSEPLWEKKPRNLTSSTHQHFNTTWDQHHENMCPEIRNKFQLWWIINLLRICHVISYVKCVAFGELGGFHGCNVHNESSK